MSDRVKLRRRWGAARDIDLTATTGQPIAFLPEERVPFSVDSSFECLISVDPSSSTATVKYDARRPDIAVELPAEVFAPFRGAIGGLPVHTFHPDTMRKLHLIYDPGRPRDKRDLHELERRCGRSPISGCRTAVSNRWPSWPTWWRPTPSCGCSAGWSGSRATTSTPCRSRSARRPTRGCNRSSTTSS